MTASSGCWSQDGKEIYVNLSEPENENAFVSKRSGNFEIWTVEVDVEGLRRELATLGINWYGQVFAMIGSGRYLPLAEKKWEVL